MGVVGGGEWMGEGGVDSTPTSTSTHVDINNIVHHLGMCGGNTNRANNQTRTHTGALPRPPPINASARHTTDGRTHRDGGVASGGGTGASRQRKSLPPEAPASCCVVVVVFFLGGGGVGKGLLYAHSRNARTRTNTQTRTHKQTSKRQHAPPPPNACSLTTPPAAAAAAAAAYCGLGWPGKRPETVKQRAGATKSQ